MCYLGRLLKEVPTIVSNLYSLGLTQQASVRRGPRASANSLFTLSLTESEASAFLPNRVCVSPIWFIFFFRVPTVGK